MDASLVVKLNKVIRDHYPPGAVHFMEVITALRSLAYSYTRVLINPEVRYDDDLVDHSDHGASASSTRGPD